MTEISDADAREGLWAYIKSLETDVQRLILERDAARADADQLARVMHHINHRLAFLPFDQQLMEFQDEVNARIALHDALTESHGDSRLLDWRLRHRIIGFEDHASHPK